MLISIQLVQVGDSWAQRVIRICVKQHRFDREKNLMNCHRRFPCVFKYVEANVTARVDVTMVNQSRESQLRRFHGILRREFDIDVESSAIVRGAIGPFDLCLPCELILLIDGTCLKSIICFFVQVN